MPINAIRQLRKHLRRNKTKTALRIGFDVLALVKKRVQLTGKDSKGKPFPGYSHAVVPKPFFYGRSRSPGAEQRLKAKTSWFVSYKEFRDINDLETDFVDLTFTGQMWKRTGVKLIKSTSALTVVELGGRNEDAQNKINWNSKRYGESILTLSKKEEDMVYDAYRAYILKTFKQFL